MTNLAVLTLPMLQCLTCGGIMRFTNGRPQPTDTTAPIYCDSCEQTVEWPLTITSLAIVEQASGS